MWLAAMFVAVTGAVWGLAALQPPWEPPCPCDCWCDPCRMNIHQEAR